MDPRLRELIAEGNGAEEVEVILKIHREDVVPPGVRIVARFGEVVTCRLRRDRIQETWEQEEVLSVKAPWLVAPEPVENNEAAEADSSERDSRRPPSLSASGRGIIVAVVDWGCDFAHSNFRNADGSTRLLALWDQANKRTHSNAAPYGYGMFYSKDDINRALMSRDPYAALGHHPGEGDPGDEGAHGTHVLDIAAGNGRAPGSPLGIAPQADLIFVHLAARGIGGLANLGDGVRILEALDFIAKIAGKRPWVVNLSMGRCGGPHTGLTLVEQGMDALLLQAPGRAIVQSTGNYFSDRVHATGRLHPGQKRTLTWRTDKADVTPNELEVWYSGRDTFAVAVQLPQMDTVFRVPLGEQQSIQIGDREAGRIYHRARDPSNGDHHLNIFLYPAAPAGPWQVTVIGEDVVDGRFHAWVERDNACRSCQSRFDAKDADPYSTTGTICNGFRTIAVGAYNHYSPRLEIAHFSSSGPTRDGRQKPDLVAPGVDILAARSASREDGFNSPLLTRKSGTSMAAPHVTGTIACMFEAARRPLWIHETRKLLLGSTCRVSVPRETAIRIGSGILDIEKAVAAASSLAKEKQAPANLTKPNAEERAKWTESSYTDLESGAGDESAVPAETISEIDSELNRESEKTMCTCMEKKEQLAEELDDELPKVAEDDGENDGEVDASEIFASEDELEYAEVEKDFGAELVELADEAIAAGEVSHSPSALLSQILSKVGIAETLSPLGAGSFLSPAEIFDAFAPGGNSTLRDYFEQLFEVVAAPGMKINNNLHSGDLLVRRALGESSLAHIALVATPECLSREQLASAGLIPESHQPGWYANVVEGGGRPHTRADSFTRLIWDATGRVPVNQIILRAIHLEERQDLPFNKRKKLIEKGSLRTQDLGEAEAKGIKLTNKQKPLYYVGIDVTEALDTVAWGHLWNAKFGWRNLLWELDKDPGDDQRRVDKAHPKLPIARLVRKHKTKAGETTFRDTCIMPQGIDAKGTDKLWSGADANSNLSYIDDACKFMQTFILSPGAKKDESSLNDTGEGMVANIVYISSHGLSTGDMSGDVFSESIFNLARIASSGAQFSGPQWLILSNCSTLKPPTHEDWLKLMRGPTPLRGIVGFQDTCPLASGSVNIFKSFINRLAEGKNFIKAWSSTEGVKDRWIVLCNENATGDTMPDWNAGRLKAIPSNSKILMFNPSNPTGVEIVPQPDPFEAFWSKGSNRIIAENRTNQVNKLAVGDTVTITIKPPAQEKKFTNGTNISITIVYVRTNYPHSIDVTKMFDVIKHEGASAVKTADLNPDNPPGPDSWQLAVKGTPAQVVLTLKCKDLKGLHPNYILWLRADISTMTHDFVRNGSILIK